VICGAQAAMPASASVSQSESVWPQVFKHVSCSIVVFVAAYTIIARACKSHFFKTHPLCKDELESPKQVGETDTKRPKEKKRGPAMSSKLASRVISTINAIVCCAGGVVIMYDVFHDDKSDYFSGCGNGIDIFVCWLGGCVIGYLVADWICDGVEDVTMMVHHIVGAVMLFTGCQPYIAGVVSHVYLMELSTIPLNVSWYKMMFTKGRFESTATEADKSSHSRWNTAFQVSFIFVRCIWCPLNFVQALQAFLRCHWHQSINLSDIPSSLPVVSLFLVVLVQFVWFYKIAVAPLLKPKDKKAVKPAASSSKSQAS
jgi:hypothetical protein